MLGVPSVVASKETKTFGIRNAAESCRHTFCKTIDRIEYSLYNFFRIPEILRIAALRLFHGAEKIVCNFYQFMIKVTAVRV